jgi:hypothetical protein
LAAPQGFEPRYADPETVGLVLDITVLYSTTSNYDKLIIVSCPS